MNRAHRLGFPVVDPSGAYLGMVRAEDIEESLVRDDRVHTVAEIMERAPTVHPEQTLEDALERLGVRGERRIPVVSHDTPCRLLGILHAWDVLAAYRAEMVQGAEEARPDA